MVQASDSWLPCPHLCPSSVTLLADLDGEDSGQSVPRGSPPPEVGTADHARWLALLGAVLPIMQCAGA